MERIDVNCHKDEECLPFERVNRWGEERPSSRCDRKVTLLDRLIVKGSEMKHYCTNKGRFIFAGLKDKTWHKMKFHVWFVDHDTGYYIHARWLYLVVNNLLQKSVQDKDDWAFPFSITSIDDVQICVVPQDTKRNLELLFQGNLA